MRAIWGVADQAVSSGTNFVAGIVLARSLGPAGYGSFAVTFTLWVFAMSIARALLVQPFVVRVSANRTAWEASTAKEMGALVVIVGLLFGAGIAAVLAIFDFAPTIQSSLLVLAVGCWLLLLQDFWRYLAFARLVPHQAFLNDCLWAVVQFGLIGLVVAFGDLTPAASVVTWVAGGAAGAFFGIFQFAVVPAASRDLWRSAKKILRLGRWLLLAELAFAAGSQGAILLLAGSQGRQPAGAYRAVMLLFAPLTVVTSGIATIALPRVASYAHFDRKRLISTATHYSAVTGGIAGLYGFAWWAGAGKVLTRLFGSAFAGYSNLVAPLAITAALAASCIGGEVALKALQRGRTLTMVHSSSALVKLASAGVGLHIAKGEGLAWGIAGGTAFHTVLVWNVLRRVGSLDREHAKA